MKGINIKESIYDNLALSFVVVAVILTHIIYCYVTGIIADKFHKMKNEIR